MNDRQIRAALEFLGEKNIPREHLATTLLEIAQRFKDIQKAARAKPNGNQIIAAPKVDVQKAIEEGDLGKADALLADVEAEQRKRALAAGRAREQLQQA